MLALAEDAAHRVAARAGEESVSHIRVQRLLQVIGLSHCDEELVLQLGLNSANALLDLLVFCLLSSWVVLEGFFQAHFKTIFIMSDYSTKVILQGLLRSSGSGSLKSILGTMKDRMFFEWFKYADVIGELVMVSREHPEISDLAKDVLSRVLFYSGKERESLDWLLARDDWREFLERSLYSDQMLRVVLSEYIFIKKEKSFEN